MSSSSRQRSVSTQTSIPSEHSSYINDDELDFTPVNDEYDDKDSFIDDTFTYPIDTDDHMSDENEELKYDSGYFYSHTCFCAHPSHAREQSNDSHKYFYPRDKIGDDDDDDDQEDDNEKVEEIESSGEEEEDNLDENNTDNDNGTHN